VSPAREVGVSGPSTYHDIAEAINDIRDEINATLDLRKKDKYFGSIVLVYSFIENILKWFVFMKLIWQIGRILEEKEVTALRRYCRKLSFYEALQQAFALGIIDWKLFRRLDNIREERNDIIHQFWLYTHRGNNAVLRKKLEKLARAASDLVGNINLLMKEIGVEEAFQLFL
jgi:hypothetical protein